MIGRAVAHVVDAEGSTRAVALLRVLLPLVAWARCGRELLLFQHVDAPDRLAIAISFFLSTTLMLVGWRSRLTSAWAGVSVLLFYGYLGALAGVFDTPRLYGHHTYLLGVSMVLLALTDCGRSYSLDRWLAVRRGDAPPERGSLWGARLIGLQISAMYVWTAYDKMTVEWLRGDRVTEILLFLYSMSEPIPGSAVLSPIVAVGTVALELALAVGLWHSRARRWLIPAGLAFHALIYVGLSVQTFSVLMFGLYLVFLDPEAVHETLDRLQAQS